MASRVRDIIGDWVRFHKFNDEAGYPLVSPSDIVLDDLEWRLEQGLNTVRPLHDINKESREHWEKLPSQKGKERRLRKLWSEDKDGVDKKTEDDSV